MTITLHWWMLPLLIAVVAIAWGARQIAKPRGDLDFIGPIFEAGVVVCALLVAGAIVLGHFL